MKKFKWVTLFLGLVICCCIALSACSPSASNDAVGELDGTQQTQYGEEVSEAMRMYREAVAAGYEGDYLEFLKEFLNPPESGATNNGGSHNNTNIVITDEGSNSGADLAALSVVKIESTFTYKASGSFGVQIPRMATAFGAGVVYSLDTETWDAYILTNYHVIYDLNSIGTETVTHVSDSIKLWLFGGETESGKLSATFVGGAIDYDVAVLFIDGNETVSETGGGEHTNASVLQNSAVRPITLGDSDDISIGDTVFAIGNPNGEGISATQGIVSVKAEYMTTTALNSVSRTVDFLEIRIDAAVNHGNSGGGLFNSRGQYIGTVNARSEENGIRDFGYAIPSNLTVAIAQNVIDLQSGGARRANLGITPKILSSHSVYDEETGKADTVQSVGIASVNGSGATAGSLQAGDILIAVTLHGDRKEITGEYQLTFLSFNLRVGDTVSFEVLRNGEALTVTVDLEYADFQTVY